MRTEILLLSLSAALTATGCQQTECAPGTIERDGRCEPSEGGIMAICGPFTVLVGGECVPELPPTMCDPNTTMPTVDENGVTICQGTGTSCDVAIACPKPTGTKQTICGQLYDFKDGTKLQQGTEPKGIPCDPQNPTTSGPCALQIVPYDAIDFADGIGGQPAPLANNGVLIDDCGRYRVSEIETSGTGPFIGLGIDDAGGPIGNPAGTTVTVAVAAPKIGATATQNLEAFLVAASTATGWAGGGANFGTTGIFAPVFRQHKLGNGDPLLAQTGVTVTKAGNTVPTNDFYFAAAATDRVTVDGTATATGANGTALINSASVADSAVWGGNGGLGTGCRWEPHAGATLMGIVFVQVFRKLDIVGMTCMD